MEKATLKNRVSKSRTYSAGVTIVEWPETPTWKPATFVACLALICAGVITWQVHKAKATEQKLAEDANACRIRAEHGDAKAESQLAYMYSHGQGVPQDYNEALRWRRKAADHNYAIGEDGLGYMYYYGQGVPQDYAEALRWYRKAADQGDPEGQNSLALMYEQGQGVSQDYSEALRWYRKAVDQGFARAEYNLGNMYYYGRGVPQDRAEAVRWYRKAADQGNEYAQRVLHIKLMGLSAFMKVSLSVTLLGSLMVLTGSLRHRGSPQWEKQRTFAFAGLLGLCYVALDLLGFRYIGILTPLAAVYAFQFVKSLVGGTFVALLLTVVLPNSLWRKVIKIGLGLFGILLVGADIFVLSVSKLRNGVLPAPPFWSMNAMLLGMIVSFAIALWLARKRRSEPEFQSEVTAPNSPTSDDGENRP